MRLFTLLLFILARLSLTASDSIQAPVVNNDSLMLDMQAQIQELKLQRIMMQEELERTGKNARQDSLNKVQRRQRIDSLRLVTPGAPLVIDGDTLLKLYARKGGMLPTTRVETAKKAIERLGRKLTLATDSIIVYNGDTFSDIMAGNEVILSITETDAMWQDRPREELAQEYANVIQKKVDTLHKEYGLQKKIKGILFAILIIVVQVLCIKFTYWLINRWKKRLARKVMRMGPPSFIKSYDFIDTHRQGVIVISMFNILRTVLVIIQLMITVPLIFSIFPETEDLTMTILGYIWTPLKTILSEIVAYMPKLFQIAVIYLCFHYLLKGIRYLATEIGNGRLKINGFYADWASPTYYILRVLLYSLMFVMIWPLLPNSNSEIFQGVSVFIGIIVSLGSTSIIGNVMAGMVMTYMRPFHIGDYIKVGDTEGEVIEKTVLVTRIRTRKNEVITIQNSSLLGSQTSNYSVAAKTYGLIVHTKVTIGYDVPWQTVQKIMETAALETEGIKHYPKPFMLTTSLDDFYVEYEINAYTDRSAGLPRVYSALHQNLLRRFFEEGVEIMSPHILARRDGLATQMPDDYMKEDKPKPSEE